MMDFKKEIAELLKTNLAQLEYEELLEMIEVPPNSRMGDFAFPCFKLAKILRKSPVVIAQDLAEAIKDTKLLERVEGVTGYVNFFIDKELFARSVINEVMIRKGQYGSSDIGKNKKV